ncbi:MAG: hypothetical protein GY694_15570 [Gammaproteobacteria bacterium]|nr:hypothetical protein [Gammaproteobacteria bacterium]
MKTCSKCKEEKLKSEFYKHSAMSDGYLGKCKECTKKDAHKTRNNNLEYYRDYDRRRSHKPERLKLRGLTGEESLFCHVPKTHKAYPKLKTNNGLISKIREPKKRHARSVVNGAIKTGKLTKQPCAFCGDIKSQGHHEDYSKPLDIVWLCSKHHAAVHSGKIKIYGAAA